MEQGSTEGGPRLRNEGHDCGGQRLQWTKAHPNPCVRAVKVVANEGSVPAPPPVSGAEAQKPPGALLSVTHHVCQVPHDTAQVVAVDVGEKTRVE